MKELRINIDESVISSVENVIIPLGIDVEMLIQIVLNRVSREQKIDFLLSTERTKDSSASYNNDHLPITNSSDTYIKKNDTREMRKSLAISMFRRKGHLSNNNITYASKNRTAYNYWANPRFEMLEEDWFLILNDWINRVLYLFKIPSGSISQDDLIARADHNDQIDLQISYNDVSFRDVRSNVFFKDYLIASEKY
jgi:antitoxin component of RelBE/YafQ-DinJ toxin-antitoxin module